MHQGDVAGFGQLGFASVGDGDFGGALDIDAAVVRGEAVARQIIYSAATFDAANHGAPAVGLEAAVDIDGHGVSGVAPDVFPVIGAVAGFFKIKFVYRIGECAIGKACQKSRHGQADVTGIFGAAQTVPGGMFKIGSDLGEIARIGEL